MDKIVCLGKNYLEHAKELGDAVPEKPVIFLKPPSVLRSAVASEKLRARLPIGAGAVHHECEIVLRVGPDGFDAITIGLDMTLRDRQAALKKAGHPWTISKVFPDSAVVGPWLSPKEFPKWEITPFSLTIDGTLRQKGEATQMLLPPKECLGHISQYFPLEAGDLVFTGTPAGVGEVRPGQTGLLQWGSLSYLVEWQPS